MAPKARKTATRKTPKAAAQGSGKATETGGQSAKLGATIRKVEFIGRLLDRSIATFGAAPGAAEIHGALAEAQVKVTAAIENARNLPADFRFGGTGATGFAVDGSVTLKEKHAGKYGTSLAGPLTIKEIGAGMIQVATSGDQLAWVPRAHLARVEA